jgi:hypothetical protein
MTVETGSMGSSTTGSLDLNSLIQSAIAGGTMSDLFGGKDTSMYSGNPSEHPCT